MAHSPVMPPDRHIPFRKGGWGAALLTVIGTAAVYLTAFAIHRATFREPTDVMMRSIGDDKAEVAAHGAAPAANAATHGTPAPTPAPAH